MNFSQIKNLVAEGETEKALSSLFKIMQGGNFQNYENEAILISGKFQKWKKETQILGINKDNDDWIKVNYSLLQLLSLIDFEEEKRQSFGRKNKLDGFILVSYWSDSKSKIDFTVNDNENENLKDILEVRIGENYIVKYSYGANLRAYLPPKDDYSYKTIQETTLIQNLSQGTKVRLIEPLVRYSYTDYWAKVQVIQNP